MTYDDDKKSRGSPEYISRWVSIIDREYKEGDERPLDILKRKIREAREHAAAERAAAAKVNTTKIRPGGRKKGGP